MIVGWAINILPIFCWQHAFSLKAVLVERGHAGKSLLTVCWGTPCRWFYIGITDQRGISTITSDTGGEPTLAVFSENLLAKGIVTRKCGCDSVIDVHCC